MTGYTVHTGTSKKFSSGWDRIFGDQPTSAPAETLAKKSAGKKTDKKSATAQKTADKAEQADTSAEPKKKPASGKKATQKKS